MTVSMYRQTAVFTTVFFYHRHLRRGGFAQECGFFLFSLCKSDLLLTAREKVSIPCAVRVFRPYRGLNTL